MQVRFPISESLYDNDPEAAAKFIIKVFEIMHGRNGTGAGHEYKRCIAFDACFIDMHSMPVYQSKY